MFGFKQWQIRRLERKLAGLNTRSKIHISLAALMYERGETDSLLMEDRLATCQRMGEITEAIRQLKGESR